MRCMRKKHLKSACCRARSIKYGGKRRMCSSCGSTWTIRPQQRGRKRFRVLPDVIERYFSKSIPTIRTFAERNHWNRDRAQQMVRRSLERYVADHASMWLSSLSHHGSLIAIADAVWHTICGEKMTIYLILLRPAGGTEATILLPVFVRGHEDGRGWSYAWDRVPRAYKRRIAALVCDGQQWLTAYGFRQGWVVQRCQFHLLANLQMYLGVRDRKRKSKVLTLVHALLATSNPDRTRRVLGALRKIRIATTSRGLRRVLSGLETNYRDFQSYLRHPNLNLPTTTNTAESCISGIRELMRRCRGFRSKKALRLWITGYVLWKKTMRCNGRNQQKKPV